MFIAIYSKSESFIYPFDIGGKRLHLQNVCDDFDILFEGTLFSTLWQTARQKNQFSWETQTERDSYAVHGFGETVDRVVAPTTRDAEREERGRSKSAKKKTKSKTSVINGEEAEGEEHKASESSPVRPEDSIRLQEREKAVEDLEKEKKELYNNLKSSFGGSEANKLMDQFMKGRYYDRMCEIDRIYGKEPKKEEEKKQEKSNKKKKNVDE